MLDTDMGTSRGTSNSNTLAPFFDSKFLNELTATGRNSKSAALVERSRLYIAVTPVRQAAARLAVATLLGAFVEDKKNCRKETAA